MNNDLLILDIDNFLDKYTRFMTKNIYITTNMYDTFLNQYKYLYNSNINDKYFNEKKKKRITDIYNKKNLLISLHNKKYFKTALNRHSPFLDSLNPDLSTREKMLILMDLENTYIEKHLNYENLIISTNQALIKQNQLRFHRYFSLLYPHHLLRTSKFRCAYKNVLEQLPETSHNHRYYQVCIRQEHFQYRSFCRNH